MKENEYKVTGYCFSDEQDYKEAMQDAETIKIIKSKTDLTDINKVLKLYHKLIERKSFKTVIGYSFLKELQERILKEGILSQATLPGIPVLKPKAEVSSYAKSLQQEKDMKHQAAINNYKIKLRNSRIISAFLIIIIGAMILISVKSDKSLYTNQENEILDKYSGWEEDLNSREQALDKREKALKELESNQNP